MTKKATLRPIPIRESRTPRLAILWLGVPLPERRRPAIPSETPTAPMTRPPPKNTAIDATPRTYAAIAIHHAASRGVASAASGRGGTLRKLLAGVPLLPGDASAISGT